VKFVMRLPKFVMRLPKFVRVFVGAPLAMLMNVLLNSSPSLIGEHILIRQHDTSDVHCNPCRWRI
jgi:hypothetical protein